MINNLLIYIVVILLISFEIFLLYKYILKTYLFPRYESLFLRYLDEVYQRVYKEDLVVYVTSSFTINEDDADFIRIVRKFIDLLKIRIGLFRYKLFTNILFSGKEEELYDYIVFYLQDRIYQDVVEFVIRNEANNIEGG